MVWILTKYVLTAAVRDRLFIGFLLFLVVGVSLSVFVGSSAITEKDLFSLIFAASGLRLIGNLALVLFIVFYIRRSFESRDVEYLLSRPISKFQFLIAHMLSFTIISIFAASAITLILSLMPSTTGDTNMLLWGVSIAVEFTIMSSMALFLSLILSSAVAASMATFAFYVLARLMGEILGIIEAGASQGGIILLEKAMLVISIFIPRLDLMGQSAWLLYGASSAVDLGFVILQGLIFCAFLMSASYLDLNKRQF